jgi:hypothetical protein
MWVTTKVDRRVYCAVVSFAVLFWYSVNCCHGQRKTVVWFYITACMSVFTGGVLTESIRRRPYQVILLDEFEKAHREVLRLNTDVYCNDV